MTWYNHDPLDKASLFPTKTHTAHPKALPCRYNTNRSTPYKPHHTHPPYPLQPFHPTPSSNTLLPPPHPTIIPPPLCHSYLLTPRRKQFRTQHQHSRHNSQRIDRAAPPPFTMMSQVHHRIYFPRLDYVFADARPVFAVPVAGVGETGGGRGG